MRLMETRLLDIIRQEHIAAMYVSICTAPGVLDRLRTVGLPVMPDFSGKCDFRDNPYCLSFSRRDGNIPDRALRGIPEVISSGATRPITKNALLKK